MTFSAWYSANVEPGVIQMANTIPDKVAREATIRAARESMAACWDAAIEASWNSLAETPLPGSPFLASQIADAMNAIKARQV